MSDKKSFIVYGDIEESLEELTDEQVAKLFRGMVRYANTGEDPNFRGVLKLVFIPIKQGMDRNTSKWEEMRAKRSEAGRKGGIRSGEVRSKIRKNEANEANEANASRLKRSNSNGLDLVGTEANEANEAVNVNVNVNANVNGTVNGTVSDSVSDENPSSFALGYLNKKANTDYRPNEAVTARVDALISSGFTLEDIQTVIDKKCAEWLGDDRMRPYLRPSTLFGDHFEEYLGAPLTGKAEEERLESEKKERARIAKQKQKEREAALDAKWREENKERLEATARKYGIPLPAGGSG